MNPTVRTRRLGTIDSRRAQAIAVQEGLSGQLLDDPADVNEITSKLGLLISGCHRDAMEISASVAEYAWDHILPKYEHVLADHAVSS